MEDLAHLSTIYALTDRNTTMRIGRVTDTFEIQGRGVVVATDTAHAQLPADLNIRTGDRIELRYHDAVVIRTAIAGFEHSDPWTPEQCFAFLLPPEIAEQDVPIGAEVWTADPPSDT